MGVVILVPLKKNCRSPSVWGVVDGVGSWLAEGSWFGDTRQEALEVNAESCPFLPPTYHTRQTSAWCMLDQAAARHHVAWQCPRRVLCATGRVSLRRGVAPRSPPS